MTVKEFVNSYMKPITKYIKWDKVTEYFLLIFVNEIYKQSSRN